MYQIPTMNVIVYYKHVLIKSLKIKFRDILGIQEDVYRLYKYYAINIKNSSISGC